VNCICGSRMLNLGRKHGETVWRCQSCNTLKCSEEAYSIEFYKRYYHQTYQILSGRKPYNERFEHDREVARIRLKLIKDLSVNSILDVGSGNGAFVIEAFMAGYDVYGIDPVEPYAAIKRIFQAGFLEHEFNRQFDLITMFDVLEHFPEPVRPLEKCSELGRYLYIDGPDPASYHALKFGCDWKHVKPREHVWIPSNKLISRILNREPFYVTASTIPGRMILLYELGSVSVCHKRQ